MSSYISQQLSRYVQGLPPSNNRVELSLTRILNIQDNINISIIAPVPLSQYVSGKKKQ